MTDCDRCYREGEYPFEDEFLCHEHYEEALRQQKENERINARDAVKESRKYGL